MGVVVGPFKWTPSQVGHECMFFSASAAGDSSNIDGGLTGPIEEWRLVPHDNNIAQRNVHPVMVQLDKIPWARLPFWIRVQGRFPAVITTTIHLPPWVTKLGWALDIPKLTKEPVTMKPGQVLQVAPAMTTGMPITEKLLETQKDRDIVVTFLQDGMPVGGMTYRLTPEARQ